MPQGVMRWFDAGAGEGRVVAAGREYPTYEPQVEPRARRPGARVRFDVQRDKGIAVAVRVRLRAGLRTSPKQRRVGSLAGAARPEDKARTALTHQRGALDPRLPGRPVELVRRWLAAANSGRLDSVLPLYAPHALLHDEEGQRRGRGAIRAYLLDSGLLTRGWEPTPRGVGQLVEIVRGPLAADAGRVSRFRIAHGQIVEQWVGRWRRAAGPGGP